MKDLGWPHVFLIAVVLLVLGGLAYAGKDSAAVIGGVIALLAAMGFVVKGQAEVKEQAAAIREQTNGTTTNLVTLIRDQQRVHQQQMIEQQRKHQDQMMQMAERLAGMQPLPAQEDRKQQDGEP